VTSRHIFDPIINQVRERPLVVGAAVILAAVITGGGAAALIGGRQPEPNVASTGTPVEPGSSALTPTDVPSPSSTAVPVPTSEPSSTVESPQATQSTTAEPDPAHPTPVARVPTGGYGGATPSETTEPTPEAHCPPADAAGTPAETSAAASPAGWTRLPAIPGIANETMSVSDAVALDDGRLAVFIVDRVSMDSRPVQVWTFDPDSETWARVTFADGSDALLQPGAQYARGPDSWLYSGDIPVAATPRTGVVIEPAAGGWLVHPGTPLTEAASRYWDSQPTLGPAGRLYLSEAIWEPTYATRLAYLEPGACELEYTSQVAGFLDHVIGTIDGVVAMGGEGIATYDPLTNRWSEPRAIPAEFSNKIGMDAGAIGPDGRVYFPGFYPLGPGLWTFDLQSGTWATETIPDGLDAWGPELVLGGDGKLYAFDSWFGACYAMGFATP
jgi:hypothetical protein